MSDKCRDASLEAVADDDASFFGLAKSSFLPKNRRKPPLPKNHRKLQENHNVFNEYSH
jgi:hypothetical protein